MSALRRLALASLPLLVLIIGPPRASCEDTHPHATRVTQRLPLS
jgi:hypothetical protein